jgi:hypothetical protein
MKEAMLSPACWAIFAARSSCDEYGETSSTAGISLFPFFSFLRSWIIMVTIPMAVEDQNMTDFPSRMVSIIQYFSRNQHRNKWQQKATFFSFSLSSISAHKQEIPGI